MTTLITGGASKTGLALAHLLQASGRKVIFASRSGDRIPSHFGRSLHLDWANQSTITQLWESSDIADVKYVYLLASPALLDESNPAAGLDSFKAFIDLGTQHGVKRFVLLSGSSTLSQKGQGARGTGLIHNYLEEKGLDYVAVRPTWFTENLSGLYGRGVKEYSVIQTVIPTGRIPFVAVQDIAQTAFDAIVDVGTLPSREPIVIGPDLLSYTQVAEILGEVLGRPIQHQIITSAELINRYIDFGVPEAHAALLVSIEERVEVGSEEKLGENPGTVVGKIGVKAWIKQNKEAFV